MSQWTQRLTSKGFLQQQRWAHFVPQLSFPATFEKLRVPHFHPWLASTLSTHVCVDTVACMVACEIIYSGHTCDHCQWGCSNRSMPSSKKSTHYPWWSQAAQGFHQNHDDTSNFHVPVAIHPCWKCKICFVKSNVSTLCPWHSFVPCQPAQRAAALLSHPTPATQCKHWNHRLRSVCPLPQRMHQQQGSTHHTFVPLRHPHPKPLESKHWKLWTAWTPWRNVSCKFCWNMHEKKYEKLVKQTWPTCKFQRPDDWHHR